MKNFDDVATALGQDNYEDAVLFFERLLKFLGIFSPENVSDNDLDLLVNSVNTQRLQNNPVRFDKDTIRILYKEILEA